MNAKVNCTKCGKKGLAEYRMALMHGPNGFRRYSVCASCAKKMGLPEPTIGGRQRRAKKQNETPTLPSPIWEGRQNGGGGEAEAG